MPIEVMAARGEMVMAFGPMKPVGLIDPVSYTHLDVYKRQVYRRRRNHAREKSAFREKTMREWIPRRPDVFPVAICLKRCYDEKDRRIKAQRFIGPTEAGRWERRTW